MCSVGRVSSGPPGTPSDWADGTLWALCHILFHIFVTLGEDSAI